MIYTYTGRRVNLLDMQPEDLCIEDIAHALACCNRFAGHTRFPINVTQHSVWAARLCWGTPHALQALLHDASEAYIGDVTKWLKATPEMAPYRQLEEQVQRLIYRVFGCAEDDNSMVTWADKLLVRWEMLQGFGPGFIVGDLNSAANNDYPPITTEETQLLSRWEIWGWRRSKREFLKTYDTLMEMKSCT